MSPAEIAAGFSEAQWAAMQRPYGPNWEQAWSGLGLTAHQRDDVMAYVRSLALGLTRPQRKLFSRFTDTFDDGRCEGSVYRVARALERKDLLLMIGNSFRRTDLGRAVAAELESNDELG